MPLIKSKQVVIDTWQHVDDEMALPADGGVIISLARWQAEQTVLVGRNAPLGIRLKSDEGVDTIINDLPRFGVVALEFPTFKDGRPYSTARLLRQRHHYTEELRAVGDILRDQVQFMRRCGFDAFEFADKTAAEKAIAAFDEIEAVYQTAADRRRSAAMIRNDTTNAFLNGTCG